jgi:hypothetical protein
LVVPGFCAPSKDEVIGSTSERHKTRQKLIEDTSQAPHICRETYLLIPCTLWSHVLASTDIVHVGFASGIIVNFYFSKFRLF